MNKHLTQRAKTDSSVFSIAPLALTGITTVIGLVLSSSIVSATNDSVVDQVNITVPVSCTMTGTGMNSHNAEIANGTYTPNIGTTTLHAFCNDNEGFAIYAAGYTGNEIGGTNSNKLVGTNASSNATIVSGTATTAGNPDISNWAMRLAISQDSGDTTSTNALTIDSAPNVDLPSEAEQSATQASFSSYHVVPNEYVKVAHKNSMTDMTATTGGVKLTTTYAAYISKTQPADTYSGQVIYTLVHPSNGNPPVAPGKVGVNYHANGSTFANNTTENQVIYASSPMYIATTPLISKTENIDNQGNQSGSYPATTGDPVRVPVTATGAEKMKVVIRYGLSEGAVLAAIEGNWDGQVIPEKYETVSNGNAAVGTATYVFDGDAVTFYFYAPDAPVVTDGYDYGYFAEIYPIYATEQTGTESTSEFSTFASDKGTYAQPTDWYGSWYADINNQHYEFTTEAEVIDFLGNNLSTFSGTSIDLYRSLTINEAYANVNKSQSNGYYIQQDMSKNMCKTVAIGQNGIVRDSRDNNTYMIGRLKDGNCWMLDNLALDLTDPTTAQNINASNTNATQESITNLLNGGSTTTGWSNTAVANVATNFSDNDSYIQPRINNASKDTLVPSYGPASTNGQAKVGIYYNFCAATASTYCYASGIDTIIGADQDICPANWRMPTGGGNTGEYRALEREYGSTAAETNSLQYNLSTPLSGYYYGSSAANQRVEGDWWSSTYYSGDDMYRLHADPKRVNMLFSYASRSVGQSMRCLVSE